jgi:signal transduction histidine kinase
LCLSLDGSWLAGKEHNLIVNLDNPDAREQLVRIGFGEAISKAIENLHHGSNIRSLYLTKLGARSKLTGVMMVGLEEAIPKIDDIELIERLSEPVGIALDSRLLYEENQRFVGQLQKNNEHLKQLDQAKDEFISLVSHQLRTPLTSVKGLLSLVLEGDVGTITDQQRGMLQQAFDSSQRMVYVIADLLNASRLQSGKFVIINRVTYLNEVVESEIEQLRSGSQSRDIELNFVKPTEFPPLLLDETKIRQVIMNFLDNALYYTPAGGHVDVKLEVAPSSVEFTVTDSGLGVPKEEQANLFTKFYRAANAKQMRPEGTGLGLYMAKKVVIAQGGSIIFKSEEGRGSTFGFMFPLDKVTVTPTTDEVVLAKNAVDSSLV